MKRNLIIIASIVITFVVIIYAVISIDRNNQIEKYYQALNKAYSSIIFVVDDIEWKINVERFEEALTVKTYESNTTTFSATGGEKIYAEDENGNIFYVNPRGVRVVSDPDGNYKVLGNVLTKSWFDILYETFVQEYEHHILNRELIGEQSIATQEDFGAYAEVVFEQDIYYYIKQEFYPSGDIIEFTSEFSVHPNEPMIIPIEIKITEN